MKINTLFILSILLISILAACTQPPTETDSKILKKFSSETELKDFLRESTTSYSPYYFGAARGAVMDVAVEEAAPMIQKSSADAGGNVASDYSTTNIQVEGVDEADIVKNDGKYIYILTGNKIAIVNAYPAEDAELLSEIELNGNPREFFINGNKLIVFGNDYKTNSGKPLPMPRGGITEETKTTIGDVLPFPDYSRNFAYAKIYDISDKEEPEEEEQLILRGNYFNSRMIGGIVYMITNEYAYYRGDIRPPCVYSVKGEVMTQKCMPAPEIYYFDYPDSYEFSTVMAIDLEDNSHNEKTVLKGTSQNMYVSQDNIYITFQKRIPYYEQQWKLIKEVYIPILPSEYKQKIDKIQGYDISESSKFNEIQLIVQEYLFSLTEAERENLQDELEEKINNAQQKIQKELEKTIIQKISIDGMDIELEDSGEVPGRTLNQFSMDEYEGYFRIATTNSQWNSDRSSNNVYVLDENLNIVGELEDLAPGERIYSARFMGERLYLVTFRNIDPLFVIDLADPENPEVLGKLKIPGYSDYLHPYDEDHIIGVGKETVEDKERDIAWQQGVKLALFDVSDVEKPKEISKVEIGDRGSDSYALQDHKAFLFSKDKKLLVIPVTVAEIDQEKYPEGVKPQQYGDIVFQGAYVFNLDLDGFELKGKVTHVEDQEKFKKSGYYWYGDGENIKRSLYMEDVLYTVSDSKLKMNSLDDIDDEINKVKLPYENPGYGIYAVDGRVVEEAMIEEVLE